jgi:uncharacterized coiled-coil protein SlyX
VRWRFCKRFYKPVIPSSIQGNIFIETSSTEERLQKLESSLAHSERLYDQLNQVVIEQAHAIRMLQIHQQRIASTIEAHELERIRDTNSKPPHYQ